MLGVSSQRRQRRIAPCGSALAASIRRLSQGDRLPLPNRGMKAQRNLLGPRPPYGHNSGALLPVPSPNFVLFPCARDRALPTANVVGCEEEGNRREAAALSAFGVLPDRAVEAVRAQAAPIRRPTALLRDG